MLLSRRVLCVVSSLLLLTAASPAFAKPKDKHSLPPRAPARVEHIGVVMMENRSFDHLFGWLPNANGRQTGLTYPTEDGSSHPTRPLAAPPMPDYQGCGHPDPDHSWEGGRIAYDDGKMDGFLFAGMNDDYAIGFYGEQDRPFHSALARAYTRFDNFFSSILAGTYPQNRGRGGGV